MTDADLEALLRHLYSFGFFNRSPEVADPATGKPDWPRVKTASLETLTAAIDAYHAFNGLPPQMRQAGTALVAADEAIRLIARPRCGVPEFAQVEEVKWRLPATLRYYDDIALPGFTRERVRELVDEGWAQWGRVCGVRGTRVLDPRQANITATARAIDGPMGTLAFAYFPTTGASDERREQVFDTADAGYFQAGDDKNFLNCFTHELGHSLGFQHGPSGRCNLSPYLVPEFWQPQSTYDIPTAVESYGAPLPTAPPDPPPPIDVQPPSFQNSGIF